MLCVEWLRLVVCSLHTRDVSRMPTDHLDAFAVRMLGRADAAAAATAARDARATRSAAAAGAAKRDTPATGAYRDAVELLHDAPTKAAEAPALSFSDVGARIDAGLAAYHPNVAPLSADDRHESLQIAVECTQGMLMALDRDARAAYLLDQQAGLPAAGAAEALDVTAAAFRSQLQRATSTLHGFMKSHCGLVDEDAACRCHRQLPAVRRGARAAAGSGSDAKLRLSPPDDDALTYDALTKLSGAPAVMRAILALPVGA